LFIVVNGAVGALFSFLGGSTSLTGGSATGSSINNVSIIDLTGTVVAAGK
jgi:hypothetical protein